MWTPPNVLALSTVEHKLTSGWKESAEQCAGNALGLLGEEILNPFRYAAQTGTGAECATSSLQKGAKEISDYHLILVCFARISKRP